MNVFDAALFTIGSSPVCQRSAGEIALSSLHASLIWMQIDSARAFQTEAQVLSSPMECVCVRVSCAPAGSQSNASWQNNLSWLFVCLECRVDMVWELQTRVTSEITSHSFTKSRPHPKKIPQNTCNIDYYHIIYIYISLNGLSRVYRGKLNDPCVVARRHQGWMVQIIVGIHPWRRGEGGKAAGQHGGKKGRE